MNFGHQRAAQLRAGKAGQGFVADNVPVSIGTPVAFTRPYFHPDGAEAIGEPIVRGAVRGASSLVRRLTTTLRQQIRDAIREAQRAALSGASDLAGTIGQVLDAQLGDSIAINGVDLTVAEMEGTTFFANVMPETYRRANLGELGEAA